MAKSASPSEGGWSLGANSVSAKKQAAARLERKPGEETEAERAGNAAAVPAGPFLPAIHGPADVRALPEAALAPLASEVRARIIDVISRTGGHFAPSLGAVELAVALVHLFSPPEDRIIWDVGHQAYAWKVLTGRNDRFETIRQYRGLSGFLRRSESPSDAFGAGHASTSLAAALGMALARDRQKQNHKIVAVIGDGAMTGGLAYEALNNIGLNRVNMLVVFNDNEMSISENVWSIHKAFNNLTTSTLYNDAKRDLESFVRRHKLGDRLLSLAQRVEESIKGLFVPGLFFEELGLRYFGPVDGHNLTQLVAMLRKVKDLPGPIVLHVITKKGKGYRFSEADPMTYHGVTKLEVSTGEMAQSSGPPSYTKVFAETLVKLATENKNVVGITAAMPSGTGLDFFKEHHPDRFIDVGIAEECAVTMAAGMACDGLIPVVAVYSTFLQRAFDQIIHDVALQNLHVVFAMDRGGIVGADGPTHHGVFDLSYLRMIPNMVLMAPRDEQELRRMLRTAVEYKQGPIALRFPRGNGKGLDLSTAFPALEIGRAEMLREGNSGILLLAVGAMVAHALEAAELLKRNHGLSATVVDARFIKPLDEALLARLIPSHPHIFTLEDNALAGGFGSGVREALERLDSSGAIRLHAFGIPDRFLEHGRPEELYREAGLMPDQVASEVAARVAGRSSAILAGSAAEGER